MIITPQTGNHASNIPVIHWWFYSIGDDISMEEAVEHKETPKNKVGHGFCSGLSCPAYQVGASDHCDSSRYCLPSGKTNIAIENGHL